MERSRLLDALKSLETELHRLDTRRNRARLDRLLHPNFVELARSGRSFRRDEILDEFAGAAAELEPVHAEGFELAELAPGVALLSYLSAHRRPTGELHRWTRRTSIWLETETGWRLRFHQGTPSGDEAPDVPESRPRHDA